MIRWSPPGPYEIVFSTREGGVSDGPYESLNLGRLTGDDVERVDENRRRLCAEVGGRDRAARAEQAGHSAQVHRARPGLVGRPGDGLWTEEPDLPVLAMTADCLPIALARVDGGRPGVAVLHAGWRGLLAGIVAEGVQALGGRVEAADRPRDRSVLLRGRGGGGGAVRGRVRPGVVVGRRLDLWEAAERALRAAGVEEVERLGVCTSCHADLFFSHRRTGEPRGVQG